MVSEGQKQSAKYWEESEGKDWGRVICTEGEDEMMRNSNK